MEIIKIHERNLKSRINGLSRWNVPEITRREILRFLDELALGKVNRGKKISDSRLTKYLDM